MAKKKAAPASASTILPITLIAEMTRGGYPCAALQFSPNGAYLAAGAGDRKVQVYDCAAGKRLFQSDDRSGGVDSLSFSPDSKVLVSSGAAKVNRRAAGGELLFWRVPEGELLGRVPLVSNSQDVSAGPVLFSPQGDIVACLVVDLDGGASRIVIVNAAAGKVVREIPVDDYGCKLAFAPDGATLAGGFDDRLVLWEIPGGAERKSLPHAGKVKALAYAPDGKTLAVAESNGVITLLTTSTGKVVKSLQETPTHFVDKVQFSADGKRLATIGQTMHGTSEGEVRIWDLKSGAITHSFAGRTGVEYPQGFPGECALSPDLSLFANAGKKTRLWRVEE